MFEMFVPQVSVTMTAPTQLALLLQCKALPTTNLSSLTHFVCSGSMITQELCSRMNKFLPKSIYVAYGMTEAVGLITLNYPETRPGSVGQLTSGITAKVIDANGNRCGIGKNGEICILLQHPFLGYYGDAVATADSVDSDGWIRTGDLGHFDEDGYLFIVERLKSLITHQDFHISPSEIEDAILKHQGVIATCVVGIPDDVLLTDMPAAVILKNNDVDVTEQDIMDRIKSTTANRFRLNLI